MRDFEIYCDLDGVLVDLAGRISEIYGKDLRNGSISSYLQELVNSQSKTDTLNFWINLDKTNDCMMLWKFIEQFTPTIITSCSNMPIACTGKKKWCDNHLSIPSRRVICVPRSDSKKNYAGPNRVLIDDLESNINEWEASGGIGILHKSAVTTLKILKEILYTKYDTYDI